MSKPADHNLTSSSALAYFDFGSVALSAKTTAILSSAVDKFVKNLSARNVISGHADWRGTR